MTNLVTKRSSLWLPYFFVTMFGCGPSQTARRFVPPVLPPMDQDVLAASAAKHAATNVGPEATPKTPVPAPAIAKEPGHSTGPCPAPSDEAKRILARALEMETKTSDPGPHRAIAEAVRMRLDTLFQHGCYRNLDDAHLLEAIAQIAPDPKAFSNGLGIKNDGEVGIFAHYGTGSSGWVGQYRWHDGMVRTSIIVTGEKGGGENQLVVLSGELAKLPSYPEPVMVLGNTNAWETSCWHSMQIRILAPGGDPLKPIALLDKPLDGRSCDGISTEIKGDRVSFSYVGTGGPWSIELIQRPYTLTYEYKGGAFVERFGFPPDLENLPEDWVMRDWSLSQEATVESARGLLQSLHEVLHRAIRTPQRDRAPDGDSVYSRELFPVSDKERKIALYCAYRDTGKPCAEWPKPVDFFIEMRNGLWYVKDVRSRK